MEIKSCLIDLDDTLIPNAHTYYLPQLDAAKLICIDLMWNAPYPTTIIKMATDIQLANIKELGYISKVCFPLSYVKVYEELCAQSNKEPNHKIKGAIIDAASKFFLQEYCLFDGVLDTLKAITIPKIMVTRGDLDIQNYKIDNTGLRPYFDHIEIVNIKNTETYLDIVLKYGLDQATTVMIGDSYYNDILPALEAGLHAFKVSSALDSVDWEKEHRNETHEDIPEKFRDKYIKIKNFNEIVNYLG
jgi:putative hydrolase of the HAD superfamily